MPSNDFWERVNAARLTPTQTDLLDELLDTPLYIARNSRTERTIRALETKGLVKIIEPDHSRLGMNRWAINDDQTPTDPGTSP